MIRIFLDESGDLGFSERSTKWFIITIAITSNHRRVEKCVKKIHKGLRKKYKKVNELHAYRADAITKKRMLRLLSQINDLYVNCIVLNKSRVYIDLRKQKNYLYNYTANILLERLHSKNIIKKNDEILIYIDQRDTNKFLKQNFEKYLSGNLIKRGNNNFTIQIKPSHTEKCLQAVDFISWAIFRKYEQKDYEFYNIIKDKIDGESFLFS